MIELTGDVLEFSFPDVHDEAHLSIHFQRTLRIPDDGREYFLPPGLGSFPLRHVDDGRPTMPATWRRHGGVMMPMRQAEAMWIAFGGRYSRARGTRYPFAVRIAAGRINAVTGQQWTTGLHRSPQDYVVVPEQPWLDGFCVARGTIRQFVAMPLGRGYTAEEQITGEAEHGGVQISVHPMKAEVFEARFPERPIEDVDFMPRSGVAMYVLSATLDASEMGLAPGGRMQQEIAADPFDPDDWEPEHHARCWVHIANSDMWRAFTGEAPPTRPPTAADYTAAGLPWFDWYGEGEAVEGSPILKGLESLATVGARQHEPLPGNDAVSGETVVRLGPGTVRRVREEPL